jgi:hypothetical protein
MRKAADEKAGSAVMQCIEKREFPARIDRARVGLLDHDSDLLQSVKRANGVVELKLPDKLAAIQLDNKLAGDGEPMRIPRSRR